MEFTIADNGIGIPEVILKDLFKSDVATHRPGTEGESGTGFGMPLVASFLKAMGGTIAVTSRCVERYPDDSGTEISVVIPSISNDVMIEKNDDESGKEIAV